MAQEVDQDLKPALEKGTTPAPVDGLSPVPAEVSRLSRHILNTFHSARKAYGDTRIEERLNQRLRQFSESGIFALSELLHASPEGFLVSADGNYAPKITLKTGQHGSIQVILDVNTLKMPEGAHALVADLWYAAPDWSKSYPEAVRHATVQLPPDAGMAAFEFFPDRTALPYILIAGLRWHMDFRYRDNFSKLPGSSNARMLMLT